MTRAIQAGCPPDQIQNFLRAEYTCLPWAVPFHAAAREADKPDGPFWIMAGGARGPGKSHMELAQAGLDDCQRFPGLKLLYLRKLQRSASESVEDLARKIFHRVSYQLSENRIRFENGSRIIVGGFKNPADIDRYIGLEYDGAIIEEITQITEKKLTEIRGSIRSSLPGWRARIYGSTNPGGPGHKYFKANFVIPLRRSTISSHRFMGGGVRFFPATYRDNPFLPQDYIDYLLSLPGPLGKAWRDGDWDIFEGMAFPDFSREIHVVKPFLFGPGWRIRRVGIDWGFAKPWVPLWGCLNTDSDQLAIYREDSGTQLSDRQQARLVKEKSAGEKIDTYFADPSMWIKKTYQDILYSTADEYAAEGIILTPADNDRLAGMRRIHRALAVSKSGAPGLVITEECRYLIECIENAPSDPNDPEDVDTEADDHPIDALKYLLSNYYIPPDEREQAPRQVSPFLNVGAF